jgi:hypothetical protein
VDQPAEHLRPAPAEQAAEPAGPTRAQRLRESGELLKPAEPHQFGRPDVTEHEFANRTFLVAQVAPLDVNGTRTMGTGAVLWLVAFVALLPFSSTLDDAGRSWWLWTCLAGFGLGVIGWFYCRRRAQHLREH